MENYLFIIYFASVLIILLWSIYLCREIITLKHKIQEVHNRFLYRQTVYKSYLELTRIERKRFSELLHFSAISSFSGPF